MAWVEQGTPPSNVTATLPGANVHPLCPYPQSAIYNGSGSTQVASSFHCGGNLETPATVCKDVIIKYKTENSSAQLDFAGSGVNAASCVGLIP